MKRYGSIILSLFALFIISCSSKQPDPMPPADAGADNGSADDGASSDDADDVHDQILWTESSGMFVSYNLTKQELTLRSYTVNFSTRAVFYSNVLEDPVFDHSLMPAEQYRTMFVFHEEDFPVEVHFFIFNNGEWQWVMAKWLLLH